jgi:dTDP-4-amino-4,6-dideoxygalactose transaminase
MPNLNAALAVAQLENIDGFINSKRKLASSYKEFFSTQEPTFFKEPEQSKSNYWLNTILLKNKDQRDKFLEETNSRGVMTRPIWTLMNQLPMFEHAQCDDLINSKWLNDRVVNIPSSVVL